MHSWVSDDGWLWSISKRKTRGIPRVFRGFFALKSAADGRQLAPKCASYFLTGPKLDHRSIEATQCRLFLDGSQLLKSCDQGIVFTHVLFAAVADKDAFDDAHLSCRVLNRMHIFKGQGIKGDHVKVN